MVCSLFSSYHFKELCVCKINAYLNVKINVCKEKNNFSIFFKKHTITGYPLVNIIEQAMCKRTLIFISEKFLY